MERRPEQGSGYLLSKYENWQPWAKARWAEERSRAAVGCHIGREGCHELPEDLLKRERGKERKQFI